MNTVRGRPPPGKCWENSCRLSSTEVRPAPQGNARKTIFRLSPPVADTAPQVRRWLVDYKDVQLLRSVGEGSYSRVYLAKWMEAPVVSRCMSLNQLGRSGGVQLPASGSQVGLGGGYQLPERQAEGSVRKSLASLSLSPLWVNLSPG